MCDLNITNTFFYCYSWAKEGDTQLQWIFDAVPISNDFPHGVKTQYRAFACDKVYEILPDSSDSTGIGYSPILTTVKAFPDNGMYLLKQLPTNSIEPAHFIVGSKAELDKTVVKFNRTFHNMTKYLEEWKDFSDRIAPANDNVRDYLVRCPLVVPLKDLLFNGNSLSTQNTTALLPATEVLP